MPEAFGEFFVQHPFWAVFLVIFMGLPIIGAVAWVLMRAFGHNPAKSRDNSDNPDQSAERN